MTEFDKSESRAAKFYSSVDGDDAAPGSKGTMLGGDSDPPKKKAGRSSDDYSGSFYRDVNHDRGDLSDYGDLPRGTEDQRDRRGAHDDSDGDGNTSKLYDKSKAAQDDDGSYKSKDHSKDAPLGNSDAHGDDSPGHQTDGFWPAGYEPSQAGIEKVHHELRSLGLDNRATEAVFALHAAEMHRHQREGAAAIEAWETKARQDPELAANFDKKAEQAGAVLSNYGTQELVRVLNGTGIMQHPEMIRFLYRVSQDWNHLLKRI